MSYVAPLIPTEVGRLNVRPRAQVHLNLPQQLQDILVGKPLQIGRAPPSKLETYAKTWPNFKGQEQLDLEGILRSVTSAAKRSAGALFLRRP